MPVAFSKSSPLTHKFPWSYQGGPATADSASKEFFSNALQFPH